MYKNASFQEGKLVSCFEDFYKNLSLRLFDFNKMQGLEQCWIVKVTDQEGYMRPEYTQWNTLAEAVCHASKYENNNYTIEFAKIDNKYKEDYIEIFGWFYDNLHYDDVEKEIIFRIDSKNIKYFEL